MSRPYLKIDSVEYTHGGASASPGMLTLTYTAFKLRGGGTMSLTGLTDNTFTFSQPNSNVIAASLTFSVSPTQSYADYNLDLNYFRLGGLGEITLNVS